MKLRSLVAVALLAPAAAFAAQPSKSGSGVEVGGFIGYETDDVSGLALRFDGEVPLKQLAPQLQLSVVGSIGYSYLTDSNGFDGVDFKSHVFKFVPALRFTVPLNQQFSLFGDAGLGLAFVHAKIEGTGPFGGSTSDNSVNLMMRFGGGAWFHVNPQLKLGMMLEVDPIFGDYGFNGANSQTTFNILFGAMFRM
jgi:opacity protein-like surface antigen